MEYEMHEFKSATNE